MNKAIDFFKVNVKFLNEDFWELVIVISVIAVCLCAAQFFLGNWCWHTTLYNLMFWR